MSSFNKRLDAAAKLELSFMNAFNQHSSTHIIIKYGIESSKIAKAHSLIRFCYDNTSKFIRYIPDSVLVRRDGKNLNETILIEFKAATTGIYSSKLFSDIQKSCLDRGELPITSMEDVFNMENEALELYLKLASIDIKVVIIVMATYRKAGHLRAQFVQDIAVCQVKNPNERFLTRGSGTMIANVNLESLIDIEDFFAHQFNIDASTMGTVKQSVFSAFEISGQIR